MPYARTKALAISREERGVLYIPKLAKDIRCPLEYWFDIIGGKWKTRVICLLGANGQQRYNEIKKELIGITDTVLAAVLKEMTADDLLDRRQFNEIPPRVEYSLTEKGESSYQILKSICLWSTNYITLDQSLTSPSCKKLFDEILQSIGRRDSLTV